MDGGRTSLEPVNKSDLSVIVLTGGSSRRMGSDKASLNFGPGTLLQFQLNQIPNNIPIIVVGDVADAGSDVLFTRENPPGSGPVAAIAAGLELVTTAGVLLLAVDAPFAAPHVLTLNLTPGHDAIVPKDLNGKAQYLAGLYRSDSLRHALEKLGSPKNRSMRELISHLPAVEFIELNSDNAHDFVDLDTLEDVTHARETLRNRPTVGP